MKLLGPLLTLMLALCVLAADGEVSDPSPDPDPGPSGAFTKPEDPSTCGTHAVVSLLLKEEGHSMGDYIRHLQFFIASLRGTGYTGDILVLHTSDIPTAVVTLLAKLGAQPRLVPRIEVFHPDSCAGIKYRGQLTKYNMWSLLDYDMLIYYDSDHLFVRNPVPTICRECVSDFCATQDTGAYFVERGGSYFNAGFFALRPSNATFVHLMNSRQLADNQSFAEQDALNEIYHGRWQRLGKGLSMQHPWLHLESIKHVMPGDAISTAIATPFALHGKIGELEAAGLLKPFRTGPGQSAGIRVERIGQGQNR